MFDLNWPLPCTTLTLLFLVHGKEAFAVSTACFEHHPQSLSNWKSKKVCVRVWTSVFCSKTWQCPYLSTWWSNRWDISMYQQPYELITWVINNKQFGGLAVGIAISVFLLQWWIPKGKKVAHTHFFKQNWSVSVSPIYTGYVTKHANFSF